jgi:hypothetical protein
MNIPSLPKVGTPPAPLPLRKIALEEHFGHPHLFMRDSEGKRQSISGNASVPEHNDLVRSFT